MAKLSKALQAASASGTDGGFVDDVFSTQVYNGDGQAKAIENGLSLGDIVDDIGITSNDLNLTGNQTGPRDLVYVVPEGATSISAAAVGGGGGRISESSSSPTGAFGGRGGDFRYINSISVTPGDEFIVRFTRTNAFRGWSVVLINKSTSTDILRAAGGVLTGIDGNARDVTNLGDGGSNGGDGGTDVSQFTRRGVGGGGAGGYSGAGGRGGSQTATAGNGSGGAAGGGYGGDSSRGGNGGGIYLFGQGTSGLAGTSGSTAGGHGSSDTSRGGIAGGYAYGGGIGTTPPAGYTGGQDGATNGQAGAIRIISNRQTATRTFPTTNVGFDSSAATVAGDGGLVWTKFRQQQGATTSLSHALIDTDRGAGRILRSQADNSEYYTDDTRRTVTGFYNKGYQLGRDGGNWGTNFNASPAYEYVSWSFLKKEKFFDIVTYTGDGVAGREIPHNLGSVPGFFVVKCRNTSVTDWRAYHRSVGEDPLIPTAERGYLTLNSSNDAVSNVSIWNDTAPTSTHFTVGDSDQTNGIGRTYVAYLWAHHDGDGTFGESGNQDIIKCGHYIGNGQAFQNGPEVNVGFEPQWILIKRIDSGGSWYIFDEMRGLGGGQDITSNALSPDLSAYEVDQEYVHVRPTGFQVPSNASAFNSQNGVYAYVVIRRQMKTIEDISQSFAIDTLGNAGSTAPGYTAGFRVDAVLTRNVSIDDSSNITSRLTKRRYKRTNVASSESGNSTYAFDYQNGWSDTLSSGDANQYSWMWRRSPGYFDVACYHGDGSSAMTLNHNLGVTPEMIWVGLRDATANWLVYHKDIGTGKGLFLNLADDALTSADLFPSAPTSTQYTLGNYGGNFTGTNDYGIAYLFATYPGLTKVGSYTGDGTIGRVIDCGFSSGARFVLIKQYDNTIPAHWSVFDSDRGISSGNDPQLFLNEIDAQDTGHNLVDTTPSGFIVNNDNSAFAYQEVNADGDSYIFYAIAAP